MGRFLGIIDDLIIISRMQYGTQHGLGLGCCCGCCCKKSKPVWGHCSRCDHHYYRSWIGKRDLNIFFATFINQLRNRVKDRLGSPSYAHDATTPRCGSRVCVSLSNQNGCISHTVRNPNSQLLRFSQKWRNRVDLNGWVQIKNLYYRKGYAILSPMDGALQNAIQ